MVVGEVEVGETSMSVLSTVRGWERVVASFSASAFPVLFSSGGLGEEDDAAEEALFWMVINFLDNTASMEVCLVCFRLWRLRLILGRAKIN